jgi:hypothetical protein
MNDPNLVDVINRIDTLINQIFVSVLILGAVSVVLLVFISKCIDYLKHCIDNKE